MIANETCSCGAHIEVASATGWLDAEKVRRALMEWRENHRHLPDKETP